ncbi:nucleotide exchange factor GrpE [Halomonas sp. MCCC 1A17488]|uniref:Protein GrpE n=1 Tax=Billgrantia sulfidoxydans TaxID=2733484 RepID=A0ABX7W9V2_9GAMM|nr:MULTISPECIES: nucleotide exchange factor GrpE [Halomonas]MCE8017466.1 nucleotide exchange factor GrpE [Halomonas sp. MCCC 1A17488]MCG3240799.1 nucleotide exchange factor GrpE [Halomonas sp. MCCC 1A17488]QPP49367.1 nucleotide exchange factor GrpE [Halomonas sp. SS10-MC5]QTP56726.1 nucleotide exchange factor GrpE [Halomonas sulfidoxydans]
MAKEPQTPLDDELERREEEARPEPMEGELDDAVGLDDDESVAAEEPATVSDNPEADMLAAQVEELEQSLAEAKDQALRAAAEAQNVRRRAEQEAEKARKFALERFVKELLPVVDSLEKALEAMGDDASEAHREGVAMTLKMQQDVLAKFGVERLDPAGEPFDPQYHEAMAMVPNPELEPNSVMEVVQKGYTLNGRLVRPAMVVVSQAAG